MNETVWMSLGRIALAGFAMWCAFNAGCNVSGFIFNGGGVPHSLFAPTPTPRDWKRWVFTDATFALFALFALCTLEFVQAIGWLR